jgi:hypothetical protein
LESELLKITSVRSQTAKTKNAHNEIQTNSSGWT